jgi:hypothetical protein
MALSRSGSRRRRHRRIVAGGITQLVGEGDRSATVGDVERTAVEMVAQCIDVDLSQWAEVGAFGIAAADLSFCGSKSTSLIHHFC